MSQRNKSVLILGGGCIGIHIAKLMLETCDVTILDRRDAPDHDFKAHWVKSDIINTFSHTPFVNYLDHVKPDIIINALPAIIGQYIMPFIAASGIDCVDISFSEQFPNQTSKGTKGRIIFDAGFAPGIPNLILGLHRDKIMENNYDIKIYAGGVAANSAVNQLGYVGTWSIADLLSEYERPARFVMSGAVQTRDPMKTPVELTTIGNDIYESFVTDGLRQLLNFPIDNIIERTLRWPGHCELMKNPDSRERILRSELAEIQEADDAKDLVVMKIQLGNNETFELKEYGSSNLTAMARITGAVCASTAKHLLNDPYDIKPGIYSLEELEHIDLFKIERDLQKYCTIKYKNINP